MVQQSEPELQRIGWNGTRMEVPAGWQPVAIFQDYLLFEERYRPVLEMKWQHLDRPLSAEQIIRRLRRGAGRKDSLETWTPPDKWLAALAGFHVQGFGWSSGTNRGRGVLLHCTTCARATLVQFYGPRPEKDPACLHLLATLGDHAEGSEQQWSIFDIDFTLPAAARLQSQEFLTGSYTISFALDDLLFSLLRFKPARVLLADSGLQGFGSRLLKQERQPAMEQTGNGEAVWHIQADRWQRLLAKLRRQQAEQYLRLRHDPENNVILAVQARSNRAIDKSMVKTIFANYRARPAHG